MLAAVLFTIGMAGMAGEQKTISELAEVLMQRELEKNPDAFQPAKRPEWQEAPKADRLEMKPFSPAVMGTIGGVADAAGTYLGMRRRAGREGNPLVAAIGRQQPELTGLTALGGLAASKLLTKGLRKISPPVADAISANLGSEQLALGADWVQRMLGQQQVNTGGFRNYDSALHRFTDERRRRDGK